MKKLIVLVAMVAVVVLSMCACSKKTVDVSMSTDDLATNVCSNLDKYYVEDENFVCYCVEKSYEDNTVRATQIQKIDYEYADGIDRYAVLVQVINTDNEVIYQQSSIVDDYNNELSANAG